MVERVVQVLIPSQIVYDDRRSRKHVRGSEHTDDSLHDRSITTRRHIRRQLHPKLTRSHTRKTACHQLMTPTSRYDQTMSRSVLHLRVFLVARLTAVGQRGLPAGARKCNSTSEHSGEGPTTRWLDAHDGPTRRSSGRDSNVYDAAPGALRLDPPPTRDSRTLRQNAGLWTYTSARVCQSSGVAW